MWSIGVVTYVLLVGYPPFIEDDQSVLFQKIRNGQWEFKDEDWKGISPPAKDFVKSLLVVNPKERLTAKQCLDSDWLKEESEKLSLVSLHGSVRHIREQRSRFKTIAKTIIWLGTSTRHTTEIATQAQESVTDNETSQ